MNVHLASTRLIARHLMLSPLKLSLNNIMRVTISKSGSLLSLDKEETVLPILIISGVVYYEKLAIRMGNYANKSLVKLRMTPQ